MAPPRSRKKSSKPFFAGLGKKSKIKACFLVEYNKNVGIYSGGYFPKIENWEEDLKLFQVLEYLKELIEGIL